MSEYDAGFDSFQGMNLHKVTKVGTDQMPVVLV